MSRRPFVPLLLVALALAGCSSGSGDGAATSTAPDSSTTTAVGSTAAPSSTTSGAPPSSAVPSTTAPNLPTEVRPAVAPTHASTNESLRTPDGRTRTYHVYVPTSVAVSSAKVPLLIALHGGVGWGLQFEQNSGFSGVAEANRFVVVYPDGIGSGSAGDRFRTWNAGGCCGIAAREDVDDVGFVKQLIATVERSEPIDPKRVFVAGHSNGGMLGYRLACELSDEIAAVGVQSSALVSGPCRLTRPVSLLHIHGTGDRNVPIGGGKGDQAISGVSYPRPILGAEAVAKADGCRAAPAVTTDPAHADVTVRTWSGCDAGVTVQFDQVAGATHAWMGHEQARAPAGGAPYLELDSTMVIWQFLIAHPKP